MKSSRINGLLLPLFSLRRDMDSGIGDLRALREWIDWAADNHVGFLQLLPVNALGNDPDPSPYSAISSIALEPLYLSLEPWGLPGIHERIPFPSVDLAPLQYPSGENLVDYPRVRSWKLGLLRVAWKNFQVQEDYIHYHEDYASWLLEQGDWLEDFACFKVLSHLFGTDIWWKWPEQDPHRARELSNEYAENKNFEKWLQWLCARQWEFIRSYADNRNVLLMGDIPFGVSMASADVFFHREYFDLDWCGGAPAEGDFADDPFTAKWGQNWGIPLYRWDVMARDDYKWWTQRIQHTTRIFSLYRIDHILGFYRIYSFPWKPTENGFFLNMSPDEAAAHCGGRRPGFRPRNDWTAQDRKLNLMDGDRNLQILLAAAPNVAVVGEDLGCVPDYVRPNMRQLGIAGFTIPHWEIKENGKITQGNEYHPCSFATFSTHDFPTIMESWNNAWKLVEPYLQAQHNEASNKELVTLQTDYDNGKRVLLWFADYCGMDENTAFSPWNDTIKTAMFKALLQSKSNYTALLWTELFDIDERLNIPGTVGGTNWRVRMPFSAKEAHILPQSTWLKTLIDASERTPAEGKDMEETLLDLHEKSFQIEFHKTFPSLKVMLQNIYNIS